MWALVMMVSLGFSGFAALVTTAPLWAVRGGAGTDGAGLVNAVLLLFTVVAQTMVPASIRGFGWAPTMVVGLVLLGTPSLLLPLATDMPLLLTLSAVRGLGFGVITVTGSSALAELFEPRRRGRAIGAYGLAVAGPQLVLIPGSSWVAENVGFWPVFVVGATPLLATLPAVLLARRLHTIDPGQVPPPQLGRRGRMRPYVVLLRPMLLLLAVTAAGGAVITFAPQMSSDALAASAGLMLLTAAAALTRWLVGGLADRYGTRPFLAPLTLLTVGALVIVAWSVRDLSATDKVWLIVGMSLLGASYGALQNLTLVESFAVVAPRLRGEASAVWNIGFDAGTGLGALLVGYLAAGSSFPVALLAVAGFSVLVLPLAVLRARAEASVPARPAPPER